MISLSLGGALSLKAGDCDVVTSFLGAGRKNLFVDEDLRMTHVFGKRNNIKTDKLIWVIRIPAGD